MKSVCVICDLIDALTHCNGLNAKSLLPFEYKSTEKHPKETSQSESRESESHVTGGGFEEVSHAHQCGAKN